MGRWLEDHACILFSQKCNRNASEFQNRILVPIAGLSFQRRSTPAKLTGISVVANAFCGTTAQALECCVDVAALSFGAKCVCKIPSLPKFCKRRTFFLLQSSLCLAKVSLHSLKTTPWGWEADKWGLYIRAEQIHKDEKSVNMNSTFHNLISILEK